MQSLNGIHVLVTRPGEAGRLLTESIRALGGQALHWPTIEIVPLPERIISEAVSQIKPDDYAVFISPNAVTCAWRALSREQKSLLQNMKLFAVGESTAKVLMNSQCHSVIYPSVDASSESLLKMIPWQEIKGKKIWIFRGSEGRELLADALRSQGVSVEYVACYQRQVPTVDRQSLKNQLFDLIVVTSGEGLVNLKQLLADQFEAFKTVPVTVLNITMLKKAEALGFENTILMPGADNAAVLKLLQDLR